MEASSPHGRDPSWYSFVVCLILEAPVAASQREGGFFNDAAQDGDDTQDENGGAPVDVEGLVKGLEMRKKRDN
jgi:hypothetical protein